MREQNKKKKRKLENVNKLDKEQEFLWTPQHAVKFAIYEIYNQIIEREQREREKNDSLSTFYFETDTAQVMQKFYFSHG